MRRYSRLIALIAVLAMVLVACGDDGTADTTSPPAEAPDTTAATTPDTTAATTPDTTEGTTPDTTAATDTTTAGEFTGEPVTACLVTDLAGVDDRSFNAAAWQGVQDAVSAGYAAADPILLESDDQTDYQPNIDQCLSQGAQHIVTVGFELGEATATNAEANPDINWTIVDFGYDPDIENVRELVYQTDEAAFAAGYLAAGVSQSGVIGTYGGLDIPTVSIFMDGLARGVAHYNEAKGADVQVIGWTSNPDYDPSDPNSAPGEGTFTGTFDPADPIVRQTCESILDEGADIMLPVGGAINLPCGTAIQDRGLEAALIGVDQDAFAAMPPEFQDLWLVTIEKGIAIQVTRSLQDHAEGNWTPGGEVGNLANDAVGLSEFHSWADRVPDELATEVEQILEDIRSGAIEAGIYPVG
ncbi:MAG TPA: BMP family ABC transporter substrate-binding protein [Acidimicrobiia bacterium]|nr:BMP family ABC transporter substrate-binding protein [Acidimicrobiia bacterium]